MTSIISPQVHTNKVFDYLVLNPPTWLVDLTVLVIDDGLSVHLYRCFPVQEKEPTHMGLIAPTLQGSTCSWCNEQFHLFDYEV